MSDTAEFPVFSELLKLLHNAIAAEIYPAYYRADERILVRKLQKPSTLFETLSSLYRNRSTNASDIDEWQQVRRQMILTEFVHASGHPHVISIVILPKMLVRIDFHRSHKSNPIRHFALAKRIRAPRKFPKLGFAVTLDLRPQRKM